MLRKNRRPGTAQPSTVKMLKQQTKLFINIIQKIIINLSDFFNYLLSRRTDTPEVVIKSNLIDDGKEYVIGRPRTLTPVSPKKGNNMTSVEDGFITVSYTHLTLPTT